MARPAAQLEELLATVRRLEAKVDELGAELGRRRRGADAAVLSKRQAARRLRIGKEYLDELIGAKVIRTVTVNGQLRIPAAEVERHAEQGLPSLEESRLARAPTKTAGRAPKSGSRIRDIDIDELIERGRAPSRPTGEGA